MDGIEGFEKNRLLKPYLSIMDLSMPRMSGLEAAAQILREFPKVPILLLTLYLTHQLAEEARDSGIRGTLEKTAMHRLVGCIDAILRGEEFPVLTANKETARFEMKKQPSFKDYSCWPNPFVLYQVIPLSQKALILIASAIVRLFHG